MFITEANPNELREEEALSLLSSSGFSRGDWPAIMKLGGANAVLASNLVLGSKPELCLKPERLRALRKHFDNFYDSGGFLLTPYEHASSCLFKRASAPLCFFGRGNASLLDRTPIVAIVGARDASDEGLAMTRTLAQTMAQHGIVVLSGGARGIDHAAHEAAVDVAGETIVMSGVAHSFTNTAPLIKTLSKHSARFVVLYPFGPFRPQEKFMFVERNRFVATLADAIVVIEGKAGSGTLYTAQFAEELKVPLYCVKPNRASALSFVPNELILSGRARMLTNFAQFAQTLVTNRTKPPKKRTLSVIDRMENLKKAGSLPYLLQIINDHENSIGFDELLLRTGWSFAQLQKELLSYELDGRILKRGSQFVLTGN